VRLSDPEAGMDSYHRALHLRMGLEAARTHTSAGTYRSSMDDWIRQDGFLHIRPRACEAVPRCEGAEQLVVKKPIVETRGTTI
jgi:hypothetical protein